MSTTSTTSSTTSARGSGWRTVDLVTTAVLGVVVGVLFVAWTYAAVGPTTALGGVFAPLGALMTAPWFLGGVLGGLIIRKPGAALAVELVATIVELLMISRWGMLGVGSGLVQGLGAELAFALTRYRSSSLGTAALAGLLSGLFAGVYELFVYVQAYTLAFKAAHVGLTALGGIVLAGVLGWLLVRALASAGALRAFPVGAQAREARLATPRG